ncbi:MAG: hypothetical protein GEV07_00170 [Streptosporangiales bacterium]|nr:hypothetical protein [Streptosporangiales bacterium]
MNTAAAPVDPSALRVVTGDAAAEGVVARLDAAGLGDGFPMASPTAAKVSAMLAGRTADEPVEPLAPLCYPATVEDVAVCAVLAGCAPGVLPYLLAAVDAVTADEFNLLGVSTTTGNAAAGIIVHSAGRLQHPFATGANCLGPTPVNAAFGRAFALACRVLGGAVPGTLDMATLGQPAKFALCLAEEQAPAGWQTWHEFRGAPADRDAVTVFCTAGNLEVADTWSDTARGLLESLAAATPLPAGISANGELVGGGQQLYVLPPEWVVRLVAEGWTRESTGAYLYEHAVLPVDRLPASALSRLTEGARGQQVLRCARAPADYLVLCTGGTGVKAAYLPSWPGGSIAVTREVR